MTYRGLIAVTMLVWMLQTYSNHCHRPGLDNEKYQKGATTTTHNCRKWMEPLLPLTRSESCCSGGPAKMQCVRDESAMKNPWSWLDCTLHKRAVQSVEQVATQRESREKATWVTSSLCPCTMADPFCSSPEDRQAQHTTHDSGECC